MREGEADGPRDDGGPEGLLLVWAISGVLSGALAVLSWATLPFIGTMLASASLSYVMAYTGLTVAAAIAAFVLQRRTRFWPRSGRTRFGLLLALDLVAWIVGLGANGVALDWVMGAGVTPYAAGYYVYALPALLISIAVGGVFIVATSRSRRKSPLASTR